MTWVIASGLYNPAFGLFHLTFWRFLDWRGQLARLSSTNRAVMQTLSLCLTLFFFLSAYLYLAYPAEVRATGFGRAFAAGVLVFWVARAAEQFILFDLKRRVHQTLLVVFIAGIAVNAAVIWG